MRISQNLRCIAALSCAIAASAPTSALPDKPHRAPVSHASVAADIDPRALWDGRNTYGEFRAVDHPRMVRAASARFVVGQEYVLGLTINGQSRAYPTRFVAWHHVINDSVRNPATGQDRSIAVTYCVVCGTGFAFDPTVDGRALRLDFYGLYNGVLTVFDHQTGSVWLQVGGRAIKGPMLGRRLPTVPLLETTWGQWKRLHPSTLVMAPDPHYRTFYERKGTVMPRGYGAFPAPYFRHTLTRRDARLPMFATVLAVSVPQSYPVPTAPAKDVLCDRPLCLYRAYPLAALKRTGGVLNESVGDASVAVLFDPNTGSGTAVSRELDGRILTLEKRTHTDGQYRVVDRETGTEWNIEGLGLSGPLAGKSLARLSSCQSQWYGWSAYFPQTTIYGQQTARRR